ncbi:excinuclease ABC subunit UvrA [Patescibacteria group bacterium]|nr:excinuclease ABC subunit UvrA [Patescibacteria group bacterium]MBU1876756.1 excinuclease ABC subunit UvrA [Patescibacteria group bacterium]
MPKEIIKIRGARVHNLKNVSLDIPKNKLVVITGLSGSGKSSLAFDTIYAEGQRRYVESLSSYARQFLGIMPKPAVDSISGISPAISIDQRKAIHNPRSTVGTITEIYDYLRLLFARIGQPHCPQCNKKIDCQSIGQIVSRIIKDKSLKNKEVTIFGPIIKGKKGEHYGILNQIKRKGFVKVRIDGFIHRTEEALALKINRQQAHNIEVVIDRLLIDSKVDRFRLRDSIETGLKIGEGLVMVDDLIFSDHFACQSCGLSLPELEPRLFSFNSPYGACSSCQGLGEKMEIDPDLLLVNENLSIAEGAFFPWIQSSYLGPSYFNNSSFDSDVNKIGFQKQLGVGLFNTAKKNKFSLNEPIKNLSPKSLDIILYGDKNNGFEGLVPCLKKRYKETDSEHLRSEIEEYMIKKICEVCIGKRLKPEVLGIIALGKSIDQMVSLPISKLTDFLETILKQKNNNGLLSKAGVEIAQPIIKEIVKRSKFLIDVGLNYLTLSRKANSLSGGEEQRIRLATQIGSELSGILYVLDEPSVGLHSKDQDKLIKTLKRLKELGNTVLVVEHDSQTIKNADWIIDVGPKAGISGGQIMFEGTFKQLLRSSTLTGQYLSGRKRVEVKKAVNSKSKIVNSKKSNYLIIKGAQEHNLKNIDVKIPLSQFVCITGVSGSGKSSLMNDILAKALLKKFYNSKAEPGIHSAILGTENINKVVLVDQSPIGKTLRSNPVTYTGAFSYIRNIFSETKEAQAKNCHSSHFSFNVKGGRCETCQGQGKIKIEMYFLSDIYVECQDCNGRRFNKEILSIEHKGKNIAEILEMTVEESLDFFKTEPVLYRKLQVLNRVGLGYVQLGQPAPYLSGGEAQRVKLAAELSKKDTGSTLYILDEPTTGLHPDDIQKLLFVLRKLVDMGNTVLVTEHNLDVIRNADWVIDLGPGGGEEGGSIVAEGIPNDIAKNRKSYTGKYLKDVFSGKVL